MLYLYKSTFFMWKHYHYWKKVLLLSLSHNFLYFLFSQNITGVVAAISDLLCVKIPSSYEVSSTPDRGPLSVLGGPRIGPHGMEARPPMFFKEQGDNSGLQGRPGQMIRPGGGPAMMQQQQPPLNFRFHPDSPGLGKVLHAIAPSVLYWKCQN